MYRLSNKVMFFVLGGFIIGALVVKFIFAAIDVDVPVPTVKRGIPPGGNQHVAHGRTLKQYRA